MPLSIILFNDALEVPGNTIKSENMQELEKEAKSFLI